jgi:hypothetical protein
MKANEKKAQEDSHVVFDFDGLQQVEVEDLAMILTARMHSPPGESVWVRSVPARTAEILKYLRLDHFFLRYPEDDGQPH